MEAGPGPGPLGAAREGASCLGRNQRGWAGGMGLLQRDGGLGSGMDLSKKTTSLVTRDSGQGGGNPRGHHQLMG